MVKFIALYRTPENIEEFERRYFNEHLPLVRQFPGLRRLEVSRVTSPRENLPWYLIAELSYDDAESLRESLRSEVSQEAGRILQEFAGDIVTMIRTETVETFDPEAHRRLKDARRITE
jgi:uncharacterized protein (TIGR02118 family)